VIRNGDRHFGDPQPPVLHATALLLDSTPQAIAYLIEENRLRRKQSAGVACD
jgi:hypothetical protein